jgi:hypothetical protein
LWWANVGQVFEVYFWRFPVLGIVNRRDVSDFLVRITEGRIRPSRGFLTPATHHGPETMKHDPVFCV